MFGTDMIRHCNNTLSFEDISYFNPKIEIKNFYTIVRKYQLVFELNQGGIKNDHAIMSLNNDAKLSVHRGTKT
ncbi:hypothetical protein HZS_4600 [Henneguya salminicola]|nr:hypothetical protein HZS_4600 [Henneguya salminicola]